MSGQSLEGDRVNKIFCVLCCGDVGAGKMPEPELLFDHILLASAFEKDMKGMKVLVTAGPTQEAIDPVRYITNHSSGKMGYSIAKMCMLRGADVTLVSGVHSRSDDLWRSACKNGSRQHIVRNAVSQLGDSIGCCGLTIMLKGKTVLLGVCGGIAAYKTASLASMLVKAGADIHVIIATRITSAFCARATCSTLNSKLRSNVSEMHLCPVKNCTSRSMRRNCRI